MQLILPHNNYDFLLLQVSRNAPTSPDEKYLLTTPLTNPLPQGVRKLVRID